jgi:diguanylate cyclase (GGDEF)-like protein/PAS domain S-box-containing protein
VKPGLSFFRSIKARATLFTLLIFVASLWSLSFYASHMLQGDLERLAGEQQFTTARLVAGKVNEQLSDRIAALEGVARRVQPVMLTDAGALQLFLEQRPSFEVLFNAGYYITDAQGTALASMPVELGRVGVNYIDRDHVAGVLKDGKPHISTPVVGKLLKSPVFSMAVPIRNAQREVIGTLVGVINLSQRNFLDNITTSPYGQTGGYLLVDSRIRTIVSATDKRRIMEVLVPGFNLLADRFMSGFEGTGVAFNPQGVQVLASGHQIPVAQWYVVVLLPTLEAFAPIRYMQQRMLLATLALTLLVGLLTWWMLRRELSPMLHVAHVLAHAGESGDLAAPLPVARQDEVGALVSGFNHLLGALKQREQALRVSEQRLALAVNGAHEGIWDLDLLTGTLYHSPGMAHMLGYTEAELPARRELWDVITNPDDADNFRHEMGRHFKNADHVFDVLVRLRHKDGSWRWVQSRGQATRDAQGRAVRFLGTQFDVTERKQLEDQVRQLAFFDPLTSLPNRRMLDDRLGQAMAASKRSGLYGALMFLDLDNFKPLNDTHGHAVGDLLLVEVAQRLSACVREMDTVARLGGDEFVVMLGELGADKAQSTEQAAAVAEKIRASVAAPYRLPMMQADQPDTATIEHHCSVSMGVVMFVNHEASQNDLMKWADAAMYQAKDAGRNTVRFHASNVLPALADTA